MNLRGRELLAAMEMRYGDIEGVVVRLRGRSNPMRKSSISIVMIVLVVLAFPLTALAVVTIMWLDTSGSMNKDGRFESARDVLVGEINEARPGDVLYIGHFDRDDHIDGRLAVDESGSKEDKGKLITKVRSLAPKGQWTNLDQPLKASKAIMLDERTVGKIIILSDGLSDPSPDHQPVDLAKIAEIVPQSWGWSIYLIGLSQDIEGLFQAKSTESEVIVSKQYPQLRAIPIGEFSHEKIEGAVDSARKDAKETAANEDLSSQQLERKPIPAPWPLLLGAAALAFVSLPLLAVHKIRTKQKLPLVFEIGDMDGGSKELQVSLDEGRKKSVGPKGEIAVESGNIELPPVLFSIHWKKSTLWLLPQESITVNGKLANDRVAVGIGDLIKVRDKVSILIKEGGNHVAE